MAVRITHYPLPVAGSQANAQVRITQTPLLVSESIYNTKLRLTQYCLLVLVDWKQEEQPIDLQDPPAPPAWSDEVTYDREYEDMVLRMIRGDTFIFNVIVMSGSGRFNLTGKTMKMSAKWSYSDPDPVFHISTSDGNIVYLDAANGEARITIPGSYTETLPDRETVLVFDIEVADSLDNRFTVASGKLVVKPDVTRQLPPGGIPG